MLEDVLADCGVAPAAKLAGVPLTVVAGRATAGSDARAPDGLAQASA
jgi:hypothetical protein